jgi:hypothetical protein
MTFPDRRLERPVEPPETPSQNMQDVIPPSQRNQDLERDTHDLVTENARPLTDEERKVADRDTPPGERVYAPASERVPRTVAGYRDVVENVDAATPERQAAGQAPSVSSGGPAFEEPSFTRVPRPGGMPSDVDGGNGGASEWQQTNWMSNSYSSSARLLPMGIGWLTVGVCGGLGIWLWMRWQRERNRPINRIRRQARQTASQARQTAAELRERMPDLEFPEDATRPAVGLGTALLSAALLWWQQSQSRSRSASANARTRGEEAQRSARRGMGRASKQAEKLSRQSDRFTRQADKASRRIGHAISESDWQQRLIQLKERWTPGRLEREKISISRH